MRDKEIDIFRAIAMMEVIVQHCCYWVGIYSQGNISIVKSLLVLGFAMPLFFVITGASNFLSNKNSIIDFYKSRLQRIIIPYWIYGIVCIIFSYNYLNTMHKVDIFQMIGYWIIPINKQLVSNPLLGGALWFIPIYLFIMILFPVIKYIYKRYNNNFCHILIIIFFISMVIYLPFCKSQPGDYVYYIKFTAFYVIFTYIGILYIDKFKNVYINSKWLFIIIIVALLINKGLIMLGLGIWDMQTNKFPPNIVFLVHSSMIMLILFILRITIVEIIEALCKNKIIKFIFEQYRDNCYTIYLFHPLVFITLNKLITVANISNFLNEYNFIKLMIYLLITIPCSAILGKCFNIIEKIKINIRVEK